MRKSKKNSIEDSPFITAKAVFFDIGALHYEKKYEWIGWGLTIKHLRDFCGFDQEVLGKLLQGYTRAQVSRYETEKAEPPIDFWIKMAKYFGLNTIWAITGKGIPYIEDFCDSDERKKLNKWAVLVNEQKNFVNDLKGLEQTE